MVKIITGLFFLNNLFQSHVEFCKTLFIADVVENVYPQLSLDNKKVLFQSNASGKWQIYVYDAATNKKTEITKDNFNNTDADWNSSNELVCFVSDRDNNEEIYLMHTNGTELKRITNDKGRDMHPYFSPDSKYILFNSNRGNGSFDIYRYCIKTGKTDRLTNTPEDELYARYAPDMKKIVYVKHDAKGEDIFVMNTLNKLSENITKTPELPDGLPMYNKDGNWIYFSSSKTGTECIYRVKPDGSECTQITFPNEEDEEHGRAFLSQDDKTIIFYKRAGKHNEVCKCSLIPS